MEWTFSVDLTPLLVAVLLPVHAEIKRRENHSTGSKEP